MNDPVLPRCHPERNNVIPSEAKDPMAADPSLALRMTYLHASRGVFL
jgi:hypothetical protein